MKADDKLCKYAGRFIPTAICSLFTKEKKRKEDWSRVAELLAKISVIQKELRRYKEFWNNADEAFLLLTPPNGKILDANPAACSLYKYTLDELKEMDIFDLSEEKDKTRDVYNIRSTFIPLRLHKNKCNELITVTISISYFKDNGSGELAALIVRPILEKRRTDTIEEDYVTRLNQSNT